MPVVGSVAAVADAGLYAYEGDDLDAAMSLIGAIPGGEILGKAAEAAHGAAEAFEVGADVAKVGEHVAEAAEDTARVADDVVKAGEDSEEALTSAEKADQDVSEVEQGESCENLSFTPDTTVASGPGVSVAISALKVGEQVLAYDPKTGITALHSVDAVMVHTDPVVEHLTTDGGDIQTTPNHPFFTTDRGWVEAGSLRIGEQIRTDSGSPATVIGFTTSATPTTMWDLTVDAAHSFFVGAGGVLVHNCAKSATEVRGPNANAADGTTSWEKHLGDGS